MMSILQFGEALLRTGDLDPVYIMLHRSKLPEDQKTRWCVSYWLYYHAGVSSRASEYAGEEFWKVLADGLDDYPRGTERRHFRGQKALTAIEALRQRYPQPEAFVTYLRSGFYNENKVRSVIVSPPPNRTPKVTYETTFTEVSKRAQEHKQFGPWISFKVADMMERVLGIQVDFRDCALLDLYEEPRAGAELAAAVLGMESPRAALAMLKLHFIPRFKAPPDNARAVNIAEIETILCKWKAHMTGHYPVGKDTREVLHALHGWHCATSEKLYSCLEDLSPVARLV